MENNSQKDKAIARSILETLIYFDIFSHPLSFDEIIDYCNYPKLQKEDGLRVLDQLKSGNLINYHKGFYFLGNDESWVTRRQEENRLADKRLKTAVRYSRLIANFPYVRGVLISGSLSKHVMKPDSDIDFFIITKPGRLWACRAFLTFFKKLFLGDSYRNFCINYFIDSESLEIPDKNVFTATEIAFLLPMYNYKLYQEFLDSNQWYRAEYPNFRNRPENVQIKPVFIKDMLEFLFNNRIGEWIDKKSFSIITRYWQNKFSYLDQASYALNFRSLKNVSKHHPNDFQQKVLKEYYEKIAAYKSFAGLNPDDSGNPIVNQRA
ncbi:MAG TPA: hypothetical protein VIH57_08865 [Bacteroidales bacterium]